LHSVAIERNPGDEPTLWQMSLLKIRLRLGLMILALAAGRAVFAVDMVVLTTGETLRGEIIEQTDAHVVLRHPILGDLTIDADAVESLTLDLVPEPVEEAAEPAPATDAETAQAVAAQAALDEAKQADEADQWKSRFDFGFTGTAGTTEDTNVRVALKSVYTRPMNTITLDTSYIHSTNGGDATENRFTAGVHSDWPRPDSPWSVFAQARYDYDEFNTWISRVTAGGGLAYKLFDIEEPIEGTDHVRVFQVKLRGGLGVAREFGSMNKDFQPEAILGGELLWKLNSWQDLTASSTYYPSLTDGEFRVVSKVEWSLKLSELDGISLRLGLAHEHQSRTAPGISPDQLSVFATLGIDF
jgi:hypothetical protein